MMYEMKVNEINEQNRLFQIRIDEVHELSNLINEKNRFFQSKLNEMEGLMLEKEKEWKDEMRRLVERSESRIKAMERKG